MRLLRRVVLGCVGLVVLLGFAAGATAVLGAVRWGDARWYFHPQADYRLVRGKEAIERGEWEKVRRVALLLEAGGSQDHALLLRGMALFRQAKPYADLGQLSVAAPLLVHAVEQFNRIRDQGAIRLEAAALSGHCLFFLKEVTEAERALRFVLSERPDDVEAHRSLAALYYDQGALRLAVQHLEEVARLDPRDGRPPRFMGLIFQDLDMHREAIPHYQEALRRELKESIVEEVRHELAESLIKLTDYRQALELLDSPDRPVTEKATTLALRAECLWSLGQTAQTRALLDQALSQSGNSVELLRLRAKLHLEAKELQAAATLLERALDLDRHDYSSRHQLAQAYEGLGRRTEAAEQRRLLEQTQKYLTQMTHLSQDAASNPWNSSVRLQLAELCEKLDKPELAQMWRQAASACPPPRRDPSPGSPPAQP